MVLLMIFILFGSTIAFSAIGYFNEKPEQSKPLEIKYSTDGLLSEDEKNLYLQRGFTVSELHYDGMCCDDLIFFIENDDTMKAQGQRQIILQKIIKSNSTKTFLIVESVYGYVEKNVSSIRDIFHTYCKVLVMPPNECGVPEINWTGNTADNKIVENMSKWQ